MSSEKLIIVLWSAGPDKPVLAAAPFVYALAARALEIDVEMHFTSTAIRWLVPGVADDAYTDAGRTKTIADFIHEAKAAGIRLFACAMAHHEHARDLPLIAQCDGHAGAATVVAGAVQEHARTLVF